MNDQRIAGAVAAALRFRDGKHYRLLAWCIMPNHVHVVVRLLPGTDLATVLKTWKQFSSKAANQVLGKSCRFWQKEYYYRLIRNEQEFSRAIRYVVENPVKAGLKNWPWVWCADSRRRSQRYSHHAPKRLLGQNRKESSAGFPAGCSVGLPARARFPAPQKGKTLDQNPKQIGRVARHSREEAKSAQSAPTHQNAHPAHTTPASAATPAPQSTCHSSVSAFPACAVADTRSHSDA